jgi:hypothetical protein|tara:strand:- start:8521 stop:8838 length:318 start_codon:yes stop_codon:yes gene_type:complete
MSTLPTASARRIVEILSDIHDDENDDNPVFAAEIDALCGELNALDDTSCSSDSEQASSVSDGHALDSIHAILDGNDWNSDHLDAVAEIVVSTGRVIRDCDSEEED